jgi:hypothetical protein
MANLTYKAMRFRLDKVNSTGVETITNITAYVNQASLQRSINLLEDTALSDANKSVLTGLAGTTLSLNGFVNTTTEGVFGPQIATATSVTKTFEYRTHATNSTGTVGRFYNGEVLLSNIQISGSVDSLQTFSLDMTVDGAVNRTTASLGGT